MSVIILSNIIRKIQIINFKNEIYLIQNILYNFFLVSFLYSQEEILFNQEKADNNASFTLGISVSDVLINIISNMSDLISNKEVEEFSQSFSINFNYKYHTNTKLGYGLNVAYRHRQNTENLFNKYKSGHYYITGPMVYFKWKKKKKIIDVSTNLGICFIYINSSKDHLDEQLIMPQIDLIDLQLGNIHSLNIIFGIGPISIISAGYTYKF